MKKKWQAKRTGPGLRLQRTWQPLAVGVVTAAALSGVTYSPEAQALALGKLTIHSALGEPLRAEIDIPEINPEESAGLKAGVAAPEAFRAVGIEYNPAVAAVQVSLQRRANGHYFLRLSSSRAFNEPFLDLVLNAQWSSGRLVRDYTLLLDPPTSRQAAPVTVTAPQLSAPALRPTPVEPASTSASPIAARATPTARPQRPVPPARDNEPAPNGAATVVKVRTGDTAGRLAAAHKPAHVSLDQMLVALMRANPDAFINGNVNLIRAGATLSLPTAEQAASVTASEARQTIVAQSGNFNELRRKLAEGAPPAATGDGRQVSGKLTTQVEDKQPTAAAPDKLTLSKGSVQGKAPEAAVAQAREAKESSQRLAELSRNVNELSRLDAAATTTAAPAAKPAAGTDTAGVTIAAAAPATPEPSAPAPSVAASAPETAAALAPTPAASAAVTQTAAPKPRPVVVPAPAPEPSFIDMLLENPLIPAAGAGLIALLAGLGLYRARQRRNGQGVDSSFLESRQPSDSFFGASGGQQIDTAESTGQGTSSMMYSASQIDAAGDVDPVAEADVYLAYGRDMQAEEILREALRLEPQRIAIHTKLAEIYAKRRDLRAFEAMANEAFSLTVGTGPEWQRICQLGQEVDPENPYYHPHGESAGTGHGAPALGGEPTVSFADTVGQTEGDSLDHAKSGLDIDQLDEHALDFPVTEAPTETAQSVSGLASDPQPILDEPAFVPPTAVASTTLDDPGLDLDFGTLDFKAPEPAVPASSSEPEQMAASASLPDLDFLAPEVSAPVAAPAPSASVTTSDDSNLINFDLSAFSLDLGTPTPAPAAALEAVAPAMEEPLDLATEADEDDPLATKLALAQEFHAIGDTEGARSLVQEVVAEANGPLKSRAEHFLAELA